jgi:hypothetical protein
LHRPTPPLHGTRRLRETETNAGMTTSQMIEAADRAARNWSYASPRRIRRGDDEHRAMFARVLVDTFNSYKPMVIEQPKLGPVRFARRFMRMRRAAAVAS